MSTSCKTNINKYLVVHCILNCVHRLLVLVRERTSSTYVWQKVDTAYSVSGHTGSYKSRDFVFRIVKPYQLNLK